MKDIELIVCEDNGGWESEVYVSIPEELHEKRNVDEVADWVLNNTDVVSNRAVYVGVYNWNDEGEELT